MAFNEEQTGLSEQKEKSMSKDIVNGAKRKSKDLTKKALKKMAKKIVTIIGIKFFLIFAIILFSVIILVAVLWFMKVGDGSKEEGDLANVPYVVSETMKTATVVKDHDGNYSIGFAFEQNGRTTVLNFDASVNKILKTLKENGDKISSYLTTDTEKQKQFIKMFMEAEIATTFPKLGDTGLQGKIVFSRRFDQDTQKDLIYIPKEEFDKKLNEGSSDILNYFTLDENMSAIIASQSNVQKFEDGNQISSVTTFKECSPINYKMSLRKCTLPFDYLWAMLVETGDLEFVKNLSDLAKNSEVQVGIFDEKRETTTIEKETHDEKDVEYNHLLIKTEGSSVPTQQTVTAGETIIGTIEHESKTITTNITPKVDILYAKTWIADYKNTYSSIEEKTSGSLDVELQNLNIDPVLGEENSLGSSNITEDYKKQSSNPNQVERVTQTTTSQRMQYNFKKGSTTYTKNFVYNSQNKETTEKTDKTSDEDNPVKLLVNSYKALDSLKQTLDWLIRMLEGNENAEYMIDITKYLLYKATGKDYGITQLDDFEFSIFGGNSLDFDGMLSSGLSGNEGRFFDYFLGKGLSPVVIAGIMGNVKHESGFISINVENIRESSLGSDEVYTANVDSGKYSRDSFINDSAGYGLVQWTYWSVKEGLYDYAKASNKSIGDFDMQLEYLYKQINETFSATVEKMEATGDPYKAAVIWLEEYERPRDMGTSVQNERGGDAKNYYDAAMQNGTFGGAQGTGYWWPIGGTNDIKVDSSSPCSSCSISSGFGERWGSFHKGIDITCSEPYGTVNVISACPGTVITTYNECSHVSNYEDRCGAPGEGGYGNIVVVKLASGYTIKYAHLAYGSVKVKVGDTVNYGTVLGKMGSSGSSTGMHLHFEVRDNQDNPIDPSQYISLSNPRPSASANINSLDGFLFIGDSITVRLGAWQAENNCTYKAVVSSSPSNWLNDESVGGNSTYSSLPSNNKDIKGICIMLGTNGVNQSKQMKSLIEKIHNDYPDKPIFVQKILPCDSFSESARSSYNNEIKAFCESKSYAKFIDATKGVTLDDGIHPDKNGCKTLANNIRKAILGK